MKLLAGAGVRADVLQLMMLLVLLLLLLETGHMFTVQSLCNQGQSSRCSMTRVVVAMLTIKNSENALTGDYSAPSKHISSDYGPDSQFTGASDNQDVRSITVN